MSRVLLVHVLAGWVLLLVVVRRIGRILVRRGRTSMCPRALRLPFFTRRQQTPLTPPLLLLFGFLLVATFHFDAVLVGELVVSGGGGGAGSSGAAAAVVPTSLLHARHAWKSFVRQR